MSAIIGQRNQVIRHKVPGSEMQGSILDWAFADGAEPPGNAIQPLVVEFIFCPACEQAMNGENQTVDVSTTCFY